jgi:2,3-dihydroxybenzoate decarboxylase
MSHLSNILFLLVFLCLHSALAREWRDTGTGTIVLEEAWSIPELVDQAAG